MPTARRTGASTPTKPPKAIKAKAQPSAAKSAQLAKARAARVAKGYARPASDKIEAYGMDRICKELKAGDDFYIIAKRIKVDNTTLLDWVHSDIPRSARARAARAAAAAAYDELANAGIKSARNSFQLAKAKEVAHHLRWRASRLNQREYGDKMSLDGTFSVKDASDEELMARATKLNLLLTGAKPPEDEG